ncbi:hypothetical protein ACFVRU_35140, partial [Streptomyces sp. NPDC057927]
VKATQELERKQTELKITKAEAERKKIEAQGIADANEIISKSITDKTLQREWLEKWNGKTPLVTDGNSMIQIPVNK